MAARDPGKRVSDERVAEFDQQVRAAAKEAEKLVKGKRRRIDSIIRDHGYSREELAGLLAFAGAHDRIEQTVEEHRKVLSAVARETGQKLPRKGRS